MAQQKYTILSKLDSGGMAEVWKGKATSIRGFEKLVAIKRVLADLAKKEDFIKMFLDEARLSLHLNHANVVQTFDLGSSEEAYFIVMEWVDGINLKGVLESLKLSGERLPVEQAVFIAIEVCKGLYHAHRRVTPDGEHLQIVHRDVSPPNVLISREGEVKLVDFGLAKAANQAFSTDQGMIKGKFSYLSPEAAFGRELDERADIFAVGAILWEMLAGRKLFEGKSNKETVLMVREAKVPSLEPYCPYVDERLMAIIYKSLALNVHERYRTAKDLAEDLARYLFDYKLMVTNYDIAELIERTIAERKIDDTINPSMMDDIDQLEEQLVQFTSLEDLQRMQFRAVSEQGLSAHHPALPNAEDPRDWAAELGIEEEYSLPLINASGRPSAPSLRLQAVQTEQHVSATTASNYSAPRLGLALTPEPGLATPPPAPVGAYQPQSPSGGEPEPASEVTQQSNKLTIVLYVLITALLVALGLLLGQLMSPSEAPSSASSADPTPSAAPLEAQQEGAQQEGAQQEEGLDTAAGASPSADPSAEGDDLIFDEPLGAGDQR